jgi:hypothetical protein
MCTKGAHNLQNKEKMKREQIIELLEDYEQHRILTRDNFADAILALPLDVPSDEEIKKTAMDYAPIYDFDDDFNAQIRKEVEDLLKDMRNEIIERNN